MPRRDLVARRSPGRRWTRRIVGLLATVAMFAVGAVAASMILSPAEDEVAANTAPEKRAAKERRGGEPDVRREVARAEAKGERRSGPTRKQRRQEREPPWPRSAPRATSRSSSPHTAGRRRCACSSGGRARAPRPA